MGGILSVIHIQNREFWVFCSGHEATGTLVTSDAKRWERAHEKKRLTTYKIDIISTVFWMAKPLLRIMLFLPVPSTRGVIFDKNLSRLLLRYHIHWSKNTRIEATTLRMRLSGRHVACFNLGPAQLLSLDLWKVNPFDSLLNMLDDSSPKPHNIFPQTNLLFLL